MAPGKQYDGRVSVGSPAAVTRCDVSTGENKTPRRRFFEADVLRVASFASRPSPSDGGSVSTSHSKKYPASKPPVTTPRAIFPRSGRSRTRGSIAFSREPPAEPSAKGSTVFRGRDAEGFAVAFAVSFGRNEWDCFEDSAAASAKKASRTNGPAASQRARVARSKASSSAPNRPPRPLAFIEDSARCRFQTRNKPNARDAMSTSPSPETVSASAPAAVFFTVIAVLVIAFAFS